MRGFIHRRNQSRWMAIALSFAALAFFSLLLIFNVLMFGFFSLRSQGSCDIATVLCLIQIPTGLVEITMLMLPPSGRYFKSRQQQMLKAAISHHSQVASIFVITNERKTRLVEFRRNWPR